MKHALLALLLLLAACSESELKKKSRDEKCSKNLDCAYGLECVEPTASPPAVAGVASASADGGVVLAAKPGKTCQYHSFGDCEGDGSQPGPDGQPQCLHSYKCRDGHCTVQCAGHGECKEGEVCKVGICQGGANARGVCYDNRDCPYPETCYYGQCVTRTPTMRCVSDLDCNPGLRCMNGVCQ